MYVQPIPDDAAEGRIHEMYETDLAKNGYVSNFTRLFSLNPAAWDAWLSLRASLRRMGERRYELATIAAASALRCRYCVAAHGAILESKFFTRDQLEELVRDFRTAGLDPLDVDVMALAEKIALHAYRVTPGDVERLRAHGLSDEDIFDVVLAASARSFFSKTLDAMGTEPDDAYESTLPLFDLIGATQDR